MSGQLLAYASSAALRPRQLDTSHSVGRCSRHDYIYAACLQKQQRPGTVHTVSGKSISFCTLAGRSALAHVSGLLKDLRKHITNYDIAVSEVSESFALPFTRAGRQAKTAEVPLTHHLCHSLRPPSLGRRRVRCLRAAPPCCCHDGQGRLGGPSVLP